MNMGGKMCSHGDVLRQEEKDQEHVISIRGNVASAGGIFM